jgi:hypothetical protein
MHTECVAECLRLIIRNGFSPRTDANLGSGLRWSLHQAVYENPAARCALTAEVEGLHKRCKAMLEQALSGSQHGDVRFVLEDGSSPLSGHRAVLSAGSRHFAKMFENEMGNGRIQVPPSVGVGGCRGLLEWVYLGEFVKRDFAFCFIFMVSSPVFPRVRTRACVLLCLPVFVKTPQTIGP